MRKLSWITFSGVLVASAFACFCSIEAHAVAAKVQKNTKKKKTVGELLKQVEQASVPHKKQTALPAFSSSLTQGAEKKTNHDLSQIKPPRTSSFMEESNDDKAKLERITDQQIQELYKLTEKFKNSPQRGDLWLRLAELYVEKAGIIDFRKQNDYDQKLKDFQEGRIKHKPSLNLADAREYNKKAIQLYEWFVRDYSKDEKMDQALFFLGYNNFELGQINRGLEYYSRLTKNFPSSMFITESHFALAEYYFENEKWKLALEHYLKVASRPRHRLHGFSSYKIAWCYFRMGETDQALKAMEKLIAANRKAQEENSDGRKISKARLEKEGLRDIVLFYSDYTNAQHAVEYFNRVAGNEAYAYIEKLAYLYEEKGQREAAKTLFNYLIEKDPTSTKAFDYKYQVIQSAVSSSKTRESRLDFFSWIHDFGSSGKWYQANINNKDLIDKSTKLRETTLKNWVLTQHQTAQNSHAKLSQNQAYEGYKLYLDEFSNGPSIADMHFFYAELLYDMEKFDEAEAQYRWVVENAPNSKYGSKAAENVVIALQREIPKDETIAAHVGKSLDPVEFNPKTNNFVEAALWYMKKIPDSEKAAELKFRIGRLHYQHNQFDKSTAYFKEIVERYPKTKYANYSANLLLDTLNLKKDFVGMEKAAKELLAIPSIAASSTGGDIRNVVERAQFKKAQDMELDKNYSGSAEQFDQYARQNPKATLAAAAYFNAAINYERAGQNSKAIANHLSVLNLKNKEADSLKPKSRRILAKLYQDAGMLEESANMFQLSAKESEKDPLVPNLYYNAAVLYEALGRNTEAIHNYENYYSRYKKSDRETVLFQIAEIQRKSGHAKEAAEKYKQYFNLGIADEKTIESAYWVYEYNKTVRNETEARRWKNKLQTMHKKFAPNKKGLGARWAAKLALDDVQKYYDEFKAIKIPTNPKQQKKVVQKKISMLTELTKQLGEIVKYDSPEEIVAALNLAGKANLHMSESLSEAPVPKDLKAEEVKLYKEGIRKITEPFEQKARESFKTAIDRSLELEAYGKELSYARAFHEKLETGNVNLNFKDRHETPIEIQMESWDIQ